MKNTNASLVRAQRNDSKLHVGEPDEGNYPPIYRWEWDGVLEIRETEL